MIPSHFAALYSDNIRTEYPRPMYFVPMVSETPLTKSEKRYLRGGALMRRLTKNIKRRAKYRPKFKREIYRLALLGFTRGFTRRMLG